MKKSRLKLFPVMLMLIAGGITSITTYYFQYGFKTALLILLSVLLLYYLFGLIFIKTILHFDKVNEEKRLAEEQEAMENEEDPEGMEEASDGEPEETQESEQAS